MAIIQFFSRSLLIVCAAVIAACGPEPAGEVQPVAVTAAPEFVEPLFDPTIPIERNATLLTSWNYDAMASAISDEIPGKRPTITYAPDCASRGCQAWTRFRSQRPFPLQTLAYAPAGSGGVLLITEPTLERSKLENSLRELFGETIAIEAQRWMIGVDGWLGDLVVTLPASVAPQGTDPLADQAFRDRLSLLAEDLWGTSFGLYVEDAESSWKQVASRAAPNLELNPAELQSWMLSSDLAWRDPSGGATKPFQQLMEERRTGTYVSASGELAIFIIDGQSVRAGTFARQHADFRRFAILSDAVIGSIWNETSGDLAIVARGRQASLSAMPPLRFETVALLFAQSSDSLAQSYERTTPMAGKLMSGSYAGKDWAPIYLSYDLVDSEYGALLNITDQMLKSWSLAGDVQYVFFDYPLRPKPGQFAFGARGISDILREKIGGTSTLFNWNTSGAAAIVTQGDWSALSPTHSSSLPVTYGSELNPGDGMRSGDLTREYEEQAYAFFAGLGDPNLSRVVSYATVYQSFRANPNARRVAADSLSPRTAVGKKMMARAEAGREYLTSKAAEILNSIEAGELPAGTAERVGSYIGADAIEGEAIAMEALEETRLTVADFKQQHPSYANNSTIAGLIMDRSTIPALFDALDRKFSAFNADIEGYTRRTFSSQYAADSAGHALEERGKRLEAEEAALIALAEQAERLQGVIGDAFGLLTDGDEVRAAFIAAHGAPNNGWIRTPSIVLSWGSGARDLWVGGHNLDARTLRIEVADNLTAPELVELPSGPVLRVPQASAQAARSNANQIARMVEHGGVDKSRLAAQLAGFKPAGPIRSPTAALKLPPSGTAKPIPVRGMTLRGNEAATVEMHTTARVQNGNPSMLAIRLPDGSISLSFQHGGQLRCCLQVDGISQVGTYARGQAQAGGEIALVGFPIGQGDALVAQLSGASRKAMSEALGGGGGSGLPPNNTYVISTGGKGSGGGAGGRGGGGSNGGGSGSSGGGPSKPQTVKLTGSIDDMAGAARKARQFDDIVPAEPGQAKAVLEESGFPVVQGNPPEVLNLRFKDAGTSGEPATKVFAIVELTPAADRAAGLKLATDAIRDAGGRAGNVLDLHREAKAIVERSGNRSTVSKLWIWVKKSAGSFFLSENQALAPVRG